MQTMDKEEFRYRVCKEFIRNRVRQVEWFSIHRSPEDLYRTPNRMWAYSALKTLCAISKYKITDFEYSDSHIRLKEWINQK
jgi:hypothetical protein